MRRSENEINDIDEAEHINIATPMYNLIEYCNNHSDQQVYGSL